MGDPKGGLRGEFSRGSFYSIKQSAKEGSNTEDERVGWPC